MGNNRIGMGSTMTPSPTSDDLMALAEAWVRAAKADATLNIPHTTGREAAAKAVFAAAVEQVKAELLRIPCLEGHISAWQERAEEAEAALARQSQELAAMRAALDTTWNDALDAAINAARNRYDADRPSLSSNGIEAIQLLRRDQVLRHPASTADEGGK